MFERIKLPPALRDEDKDGIYENLKVLWDLVQNKPSTFPPSSHQHGDADLLGIDWNKVLNKPSVFPPSAHTHNVSDINSLLLGKFFLERVIDLSTSSRDLTDINTNGDIFIFLMHNTYNGSGDDLFLYPNGISYDSQFYLYGFWYDTSSGERLLNINTSGFAIGENYPNEINLTIISTSTKQGIRIRAYDLYNSVNLNGLSWNNTTDPWTTLGTLSTITMSGKLFIFRVVTT